ncbi:MAG: 6-phosphogluconolactonase, partial [Pirellulaceae bacterium]
MPFRLFLLLVCASFTNSLTAETLVFVSVAGEKQIATLALNEATGELKHVRNTAINGEPGPLSLHPSGNSLFASIRNEGRLVSFAIGRKDGELTKVSEIAAGADPAYHTTDPSGRYLLSAYYEAAKVCVHSIGEDGALAETPHQTVATDEKAHGIAFDSSGKFVYVPHTGPNQIYQFRFDSKSGRLSSNKPLAQQFVQRTGPRHVATHPLASVLYTNYEQGGKVARLRIVEKNGTLKLLDEISTLPAGFTGSHATARMELSPDGRFLYVANRGPNTIAGYSVDQKTGELTAIGQTPTEPNPRAFNISPSGKTLVAAGQDSGKLVTFRID